jgi:hypothetical protein
MEQATTRCTNCGTDWSDELGALQKAREYCPVCHFQLTAAPAPESAAEDDFAGQLRALIERSLTTGTALDSVGEALREELAFIAALARPDRRHYVQVIDIGPSEALSVYVAPGDARQALQRRSA